MRSALGVLVFGLGIVCALFFGGWGLLLSARLVNELAGLWAMIAAVVLFPLTLAIVPWYAVAAHGDWAPVAVSYGGAALTLILFGTGSAVVVSHLGSSSGFGKPRRRIPFLSRGEP